MSAPQMETPAVGAAGAEVKRNGADVQIIQTEEGAVRILRPQVAHTPAGLKPSRWACWHAEPKKDAAGNAVLKANGKPKIGKCPRHPSGHPIATDKPEQWLSFDACAAAVEDFSGFGVLMESGSGIVGIDIDDARETVDKNPRLKALLKRARKAGLYCEKSPSGEGLRAFVRGTMGTGGRRRGSVEAYCDKRFLTVTGVPFWPGEIKEAQWFIDELLEIIGEAKADGAPVVTVANHEDADPAIVEKLAAWAEEQHPRLWFGQWDRPASDLGGKEYPSQSEADFALAGHVAREAAKRGIAQVALQATILAVFERSGLYRPEKRQQIERYAIPKAVKSVSEAVKPVAGDAPAVAFATAEPGDIMAGRLYAQVNRGKLLYVSQAGRWMAWDGTRWNWCSRGEEMALAKHISTYALDWASKLCAQDAEKHRKRMAFALRLQNLPRIEAMVALAKSEPGMAVGHMSELDADPWLLGVRNGVVNLKDGTLLAADPEMKITRQVAAEYRCESECPRWLKFLEQVFDGDKDTIGFIQRALGYTLTGTTTEEVLFICYGGGANGKSVLANVMSTIMSDYGQMAPPSLLTARREGDAGPRNDVARLCGARLVQINELNQGDRLDEQVVKRLAGREMDSARFLYKEHFDFWPTAKPWLRTNHRPVITGEDDGIWRRVMLIPFKRKFSEAERDPWLESKLLEERDGILAWMVEGCLDWKRHGLRPSELIRRESASYRRDSDLLGEFLDDKTDIDPDGRTEQVALFSAWRQWCEHNGVRSGSKKSFTRKLEERGFEGWSSNSRRFYKGLALRSGLVP